MRRLLRFLDGMPRGLRWALCVPVGIGCSFIVLGILDTGVTMAAGRYRPMPGVLEVSTAAFVAGVTRVLFPAVISPRPWPVAIIMFALDVLLRVGPFAYMVIAYEYMRPRSPLGAVAIAAGVVGACVGLYLVTRVMNAAAQASGS